LLLLFDVIGPAGWATGIVRVEDMALGCAVAAASGVLFWPHGASATLRRELAAGLHSSATYLRATLDYALSLCDSVGGTAPTPDRDRERADDAARRLDNAFRQFSTERGMKPGAAGPAAGLAVTAAYLRSTGDAVYDVWRDQDPCPGERPQARLALMQAADAVEHWYQLAAGALVGQEALEKPTPADEAAAHRLATALRDDLGSDDRRGNNAIRMIWSFNLLQAVARRERQVSAAIADVARMDPR
jgi:uncharacterized membrane protein YccC